MIGQRKCRRCKEMKQIEEFEMKSGFTRLARTCSECYGRDVKKEGQSKAEKERIKAIMSVPINPKATRHYYIAKSPIQRDQELGEL